MRSVIKITMLLLCGLLMGCTNQGFDRIKTALKQNDYSAVTLKTAEMDETELLVSAEELFQVIKAWKLEKTDVPKEEAIFLIAMQQQTKTDEIEIYPSVLRVNDMYLHLSVEQHTALRKFYEKRMQDHQNLLGKLAMDLRHGKYQKAFMTSDHISIVNLDMKWLELGLSDIHITSKKLAGNKRYEVTLVSETGIVIIEVGETYIKVNDQNQIEYYALNNEMINLLDRYIQEAYYAVNQNPEQFHGDYIDVPDFLNRNQQLLFQQAYAMYAAIDKGAVSGDAANGLFDCVNFLAGEKIRCLNRASYQKFPTYDAFDAYLHSLFTDEMVIRILESGYFQSFGKMLYAPIGGRGTNINYLRHTYELIQKTRSIIRFYIVGEYESYDDGSTTTSTEKYLAQIDLTDDGWRVSKLLLPN